MILKVLEIFGFIKNVMIFQKLFNSQFVTTFIPNFYRNESFFLEQKFTAISKSVPQVTLILPVVVSKRSEQ